MKTDAKDPDWVQAYMEWINANALNNAGIRVKIPDAFQAGFEAGKKITAASQPTEESGVNEKDE